MSDPITQREFEARLSELIDDMRSLRTMVEQTQKQVEFFRGRFSVMITLIPILTAVIGILLGYALHL